MGSLRIIAGTLKGRRIRVLDVAGLRPTPDRAREALFDILGHDLSGVRVLDAFAGTGALGLEALSRGAATAAFVESDPRIAEALRSTLRELGVESRGRVITARAEGSALSGLGGGPFDLVLADPPYAAAREREGFLRDLARARGVLASAVRLAIERERGNDPVPPPEGFERVRIAHYGRTCFDFYARSAAGPPIG